MNEITKEKLLNTALPIIQGLLASGHYTIPKEEVYGIEESQVIRCFDSKNIEEDWREIFADVHPSIVVEESIRLAYELIKQIKIDFNYIEDKFYYSKQDITQ